MVKAAFMHNVKRKKKIKTKQRETIVNEPPGYQKKKKKLNKAKVAR